MPTASSVSIPRVHLAHLCRPWPASGAPKLRAWAGLLVPHRPTFVQIALTPDLVFGVNVIPGVVGRDGTQDLTACSDDDCALVTAVARMIHADAALRAGFRPRGAQCLSASLIPFPVQEVARVS